MSLTGNAEFAVLLGSGLGRAVNGIPVQASVSFTEVAGLTAEDIDVSVSGSQVTVEIERQVPQDRFYILDERLTGKMSRTIDLPGVVGADAVQARLKDGVLTLTMPKHKDAQATQIIVSPGEV